jgi:hypothetical protein
MPNTAARMDFRFWCSMDWGFQLPEVKQLVFTRHARFDAGVPLACVELTSLILPNIELSIEESDIHFSRETLDVFFESEIIPRMQAQE